MNETNNNDIEKIFDLENDINMRLTLIESLHIDTLLEIIKKITGMYQFSGTKSLQSFLISIVKNSNVSSNIKALCIKSLFVFEEFLEDTSNKEDIFFEIKVMSNDEIILRNKKRQYLAYDTLLHLCTNFDDSVSTTYKISLIFLLLEHTYDLKYYKETLSVFENIFNDSSIDCTFRYKTILSLDNQTNIYFKQQYKFDSLHLFCMNENNLILNRILAIQNILQNFKPDNYVHYETILLSFANDNYVNYNIRADSADVILNQGQNIENKNEARKILLHLGSAFGKVRTIYDNAQNVHTEKIEESCEPIINFLVTVKTMISNNQEIDGIFVSEQILDIINQTPLLKKDKIKLSLSRISLDRGLYNNFSLDSILIKLWSYILSPSHNNKDELTNRLIEELEEMSETCSSGFVTRLLNTISGYVKDINLYISYEDQIISNFVGRLNSYTKKITLTTSPFNTYKKYDVIKLHIKKQSKSDENLMEIIENLNEEDFLNYLIEFRDDVIDEMMEDRNDFDKRQSFILFFRTYISIIREELYIEFKNFVDDNEFDIYFRKAIATYEGIGRDFI